MFDRLARVIVHDLTQGHVRRGRIAAGSQGHSCADAHIPETGSMALRVRTREVSIQNTV